MPYLEYDFSHTPAIRRIAYESRSSQLVVIFTANEHVIYQYQAPRRFGRILRNRNSQELLDEVNALQNRVEINEFPHCTMYIPREQENIELQPRLDPAPRIDYSQDWLEVLGKCANILLTYSRFHTIPNLELCKSYLEGAELHVILLVQQDRNQPISRPPPPVTMNVPDHPTGLLPLKQARYIRYPLIEYIGDCHLRLAVKQQSAYKAKQRMRKRGEEVDDGILEIPDQTEFERITSHYDMIVDHWTRAYNRYNRAAVWLRDLAVQTPNDREHQAIVELLKANAETKYVKEKKEKTIVDFTTDRNKLQGKHDQMVQQRDQAKQRMGEGAWKNNPRPKKDYSTIRALLLTEINALTSTIDAILPLTILAGQ